VEANEINMFWRGLTLDSRIFLAAVIKSVIMVMSWILSIFIAGMSLVQIAMSSAFVKYGVEQEQSRPEWSGITLE